MILKKLKTKNFPRPEYYLEDINLNTLVGSLIKLSFTGKIACLNCQKSIKKTYNQGYCFICAQKLAACDICIVRPELCHFHLGTCREPEWGRQNCMIPHAIYLANSAGLKVGITRAHQQETRWVDQGASQALQIGLVSERRMAGEVEVKLKTQLKDRTDWRKLLTLPDQEVNLLEEFEKIKPILQTCEGFQITTIPISYQIEYPVKALLQRASVFNEQKSQELSGILNGIRGQYLLIGEQAINIRKYQGYEVELSF